MPAPVIRAFFDEPTNTVSYLIADPKTKRAAIIDPVLDYDHAAGEVDIRSVERILEAARSEGWTVDWSLETHAHADHLSGRRTSKPRRARRSRSASISATFNGSFGRCSPCKI